MIKTYLVEGEAETIEQVFSAPSKTINYKNRGVNSAKMHLVSTSPAYNTETITVQANMKDPISLPVITDRIKFTFTEKTQIELIIEE